MPNTTGGPISQRPLPTDGGFFVEAQSASAPKTNTRETVEAVPPSRLSPVQITRLRSHLDAKVLSIQRRYSKRFHRSSSEEQSRLEIDDRPLATASEFISACRDDLLPIIFRIDPVGAQQTSTVVAYAMSVTELITQGVMGYPSLDDPKTAEVNGEDRRSSEEAHTSSSLQQASPFYSILHVIHLIDALWSALLLGRSISYPLASERAHLQLAYSHPSRQSDLPRPSSIRDTNTLLGSLGSKTCTATDRVRLKNLLLTRRVELEDWLSGLAGVFVERKGSGDEDLKPAEEEDNGDHFGRSRKKRKREEKANGREQDENTLLQEQARAGAAEGHVSIEQDSDDGEESELEEVALDGGQERSPTSGIAFAPEPPSDDSSPYPTTTEQQRYNALFDRKLDPDSDSDSEGSTSESESEQRRHDHDTVAIGKQTDDDDSGSQVASHQRDDGDLAGDGNSPTQEGIQPVTAMQLPTDSLQLQTITSKFFARSFSVMERLTE